MVPRHHTGHSVANITKDLASSSVASVHGDASVTWLNEPARRSSADSYGGQSDAGV